MTHHPTERPATLALGPFGWMHPERVGAALAVLSALALALSVWLAVLGAPLHTDVAPTGIVAFELARTAAGAGAILDSWDAPAREAAMLVQGVDFLYLLVYPAAFSIGAVWLGRRLGGRWQRLALPLAWAMWLAAPLDAVENLALIEQIQSGPSEAAAWLAWACAIPKFALVIVLAGFVIAGFAALGVRRARA